MAKIWIRVFVLKISDKKKENYKVKGDSQLTFTIKSCYFNKLDVALILLTCAVVVQDPLLVFLWILLKLHF